MQTRTLREISWPPGYTLGVRAGSGGHRCAACMWLPLGAPVSFWGWRRWTVVKLFDFLFILFGTHSVCWGGVGIVSSHLRFIFCSKSVFSAHQGPGTVQWCQGSVTAFESAPPDPSSSHFLPGTFSVRKIMTYREEMSISPSYPPPWWAQFFAWSGGYSVEIT